MCQGGEGATWRSAAAVSPSAGPPAETPLSPRPGAVCPPAEGDCDGSAGGLAAGERSKHSQPGVTYNPTEDQRYSTSVRCIREAFGEEP